MIQFLPLMTLVLASNNITLAEAQDLQNQKKPIQTNSTSTNQTTQTNQTNETTQTTQTNISNPFTSSANQSDIKSLPSGTKYKILKEGTGDSPSINDYVRANYTMSLVDGKVIGTSKRKDAPPLLEVSALPKGLQETVKMMKPGSHWIIYVPADMAYGKRTYKTVLPANSPLIFDFELLSVKNPPNEEVTSVIEEFEEKD